MRMYRASSAKYQMTCSIEDTALAYLDRMHVASQVWR